MKKEKKIICPVCYKEHKTRSALASHFRHMDKDHQNFKQKFYKKGWEEKILNKISKFQAKHVKNNIINKNIGASLMQIQLCGSV